MRKWQARIAVWGSRLLPLGTVSLGALSLQVVACGSEAPPQQATRSAAPAASPAMSEIQSDSVGAPAATADEASADEESSTDEPNASSGATGNGEGTMVTALAPSPSTAPSGAQGQ